MIKRSWIVTSLMAVIVVLGTQEKVYAQETGNQKVVIKASFSVAYEIFIEPASGFLQVATVPGPDSFEFSYRLTSVESYSAFEGNVFEFNRHLRQLQSAGENSIEITLRDPEHFFELKLAATTSYHPAFKYFVK